MGFFHSPSCSRSTQRSTAVAQKKKYMICTGGTCNNHKDHHVIIILCRMTFLARGEDKDDRLRRFPNPYTCSHPCPCPCMCPCSFPYIAIPLSMLEHTSRDRQKGTQLALSLIDDVSCMSYIRICSGISFSPNSNVDSIFRCPVVTTEYMLVVLALVVILRIWYVVCFRSTLLHNNTTRGVLAVKYGVRWPVHRRCG